MLRKEITKYIKVIKRSTTEVIKYFEINISYKIKQMILKELCELSSRTSGLVYYQNVDTLYYNIPYEKFNIGITVTKSNGEPIMFQNGEAVAWNGGSMIDSDPYNSNRLIITVYDLNNILDELEKDGFIKQNSSKKKHYHRVILQLKGKEFYHKGGYNYKYFIYKWIKKNISMITIIISMITIILTHHLLKSLI